MTSRVSTSRVFERDTPLFRESVSGRLDKFPRNAWARWGLRLLIAAFFAAVTAVREALHGAPVAVRGMDTR